MYMRIIIVCVIVFFILCVMNCYFTFFIVKEQNVSGIDLLTMKDKQKLTI